ncbi:MAG TPA: hypothetical protein DHU96_00280 [Actinobacteria bacterium]|nr:hypothetical protein [Actinomycetota bacterium]
MRNVIFRFARPMTRLRGRDERGAIGVMIAVLIGAGVLLGAAVLAVDAGEIYQNRAELQNGADAGALAVAKSCALGTCDPGLAAQYADLNASKLTGNTAGIYWVCGSGLGNCQGPNPGTVTNCPSPSPGVNWVDVNTYTQMPGGVSHLLPPVFARMLLGGSSYNGTTVYACAQAAWGAPTTATTVGFTISACEWDTATSNGISLAPPPPYSMPPSATLIPFDQSLTLHDYSKKVTSGTCPANPADADAPGAFGWLQDKKTTCSVLISNNQYATGTGVEAQNCAAVLQAAWQNQTILYVPVYSSVTLQGSNTVYTLKGFAGFVVTGYNLLTSGAAKCGQGSPASCEPDWLNPGLLCGPPTVCIDGVFVQALCLPASCPTLGGTNLGLTVVRLTG